MSGFTNDTEIESIWLLQIIQVLVTLALQMIQELSGFTNDTGIVSGFTNDTGIVSGFYMSGLTNDTGIESLA